MSREDLKTLAGRVVGIGFGKGFELGAKAVDGKVEGKDVSLNPEEQSELGEATADVAKSLKSAASAFGGAVKKMVG